MLFRSRFYREGPAHTQTQANLRRRIDKMIYMRELEESKKQAEKALAEELSLKSFARKGAPAKQQQNSKSSNAHDTESSVSGADTRVKEQLSHGNRQLQAMANQVRALGALPLFVKRPNQGSNEKGNNSGKSSSSKSSSSSSDKSSSRGRSKTKGSDRGAEHAKAKAGKSDANKSKGKPKAAASPSPSKDLSHITCHNCKKTGHYSNKCPDAKKNKGSPGRSPSPDGSRSSSSKSSSSTKSDKSKSSSAGQGVCHFHKPWR